MFIVRIEDHGVEATFTALTSELQQGFRPEMEDAGTLMASGVRKNFEQGGKDGSYAPLSPRTLRDRRRRAAHGERLQGGEDEPLVAFGGNLLAAATAETDSVVGSAYALSNRSVTVGIQGDQIFYAARAMGLSGNNPERNPIHFNDDIVLPIIERMRRGLAQRVARATRGTG